MSELKRYIDVSAPADEEIRADLWPVMTRAELEQELAKLRNKMNVLIDVMSSGTLPNQESYVAMLNNMKQTEAFLIKQMEQ